MILTPLLYLAAYIAMPENFAIKDIDNVRNKAFVCSLIGLWGGLVIGAQTEYMTSSTYSPVRQLTESCKTGAATNIISGLALGYKSTIVPVFVLAAIIFVCFD